MIKKNTIFDFLNHFIMAFAISIIVICILAFTVGEQAKEISSVFALGKSGIPLSTVIQFLALAFILTLIEWIFCTDRLIKRLSLTLRIIGMLLANIMTVAFFAAIFGWFPVNMVMPWISFFICYAVCAAVSVIIVCAKEKKENEKLQEALELFKQEDMQSCKRR